MDKFMKLLISIGLLMTLASPTYAQVPIRGGSGSGTGLLTSDADDASIASGQTNSNVNSLVMVYNGSAWVRQTLYANDATAAATTFLPTLVGLVETSAPTRTNGRMAGMSFFAGGGARVTLVDAAGAALTVAQDAVLGTGTFTEASSTAPGLVVRRDTLSTLVNTTNEFTALITASTGALWTSPSASVSGGADGLKYTSAGATEDEHAVKTTAGTLYSITATNTNAAARYIRCENDTAANTTPGSETPEIDLAIPGNTAGAGITFNFPVGFNFSTALTCWLVTGAADTDVAEVAANEIKLLYSYK